MLGNYPVSSSSVSALSGGSTAILTCVSTVTTSAALSMVANATLSCASSRSATAKVFHKGISNLTCVSTITATPKQPNNGSANLNCVSTITAVLVYKSNFTDLMAISAAPISALASTAANSISSATL